MNAAVLFVDDDPNLLAGVVRNLRGRFELHTALGAQQALAAVRQRGPYTPFAVVVADMQMPGINGVDFLTQVAELAPLTVRMMLTGQSDQQTAIDAVNKGNIFRFMTKPCSVELLRLTLDAGLEQFRLVTAEKELLAKTLGGSVKLLTDVLAMAQPKAFGRAARVRRLVQQIGARRGIEPMWPLEIAAMLSQVGCVTLPENVLDQVYRAQALTAADSALFLSHPKVGAELVANVPRLGPVAEIIAYQEKRFDGSGPPDGGREGEEIPIGARVLKLALDFDALLTSGHDEQQAAQEVARRKGWYDSNLIRCLAGSLSVRLDYEERQVNIAELADGMILDEHVISCEGDILITRGHEVTAAMRHRLTNYLRSARSVKQPVRVRLPR
ncbi:MAG TPA: HD domain-containing phosphohydrolase [Pirellulales bacterium]|nr:HD domain-containing phosphohydrolase [Pirellulales bacterium]